MANQLPLPKSWMNVITGRCYERHQITFYTKVEINEIKAFMDFFHVITAQRVAMISHETTLEDDNQKIIITYDVEIYCPEPEQL